MKRIALFLGILGALFVGAHAPAHAQCPGRVALIVEVEHPTVPLLDHDGFETWATAMDYDIRQCVAERVISQDYGYYLEIKVMGRVVRGVCLVGDDYEKRQALALFDETIIEARPLFLSASFRSLVSDLHDKVHSDCQTGGI